MASTEGGEVDIESKDQSPVEIAGSEQAPAPEVTPSGTTNAPFVYPIRSLLPIVGPSQSTGLEKGSSEVNSKVYSDLAASLHREVAARRQAEARSPGDHPNLGYRSTDRSSLGSLRRPASSNGDKTGDRRSGNFERQTEQTATATFPSNINPGNMLNGFVPLPPLPKAHRSTSSFEIRTGPSPLPADGTQASGSETIQGGTVRDFALEDASRRTAPQEKAPSKHHTQTLTQLIPLPYDQEARPSSHNDLLETTDADRSNSASFSSLVRLPPVPKEGEIDDYSSSRSRPSSFEKPSADVSLSDEAKREAMRLQGPPVTVRLKYQRDENGHHHVTGREGTFTRCEDEVRPSFL
jgi:hypothetical protein